MRFLAIVSVLAVSGCATTPEQQEEVGETFVAQAKSSIPGGCANSGSTPVSTFDIGLNALCQGFDLIGKATLAPSAANELTYAETNEFDEKLHRSLKYRHDQVTVAMTGTGFSRAVLETEILAPDSPRMAVWLANLQGKGGEIVACAERQPQFILSWIVGALVKLADDWVTYRPLNSYSGAYIVYNLDSGEALAESVTFTKAEPACPSNLIELGQTE